MRAHKQITATKGDKVRVITDLQVSDTYQDKEGKYYIHPNGRAYSVSTMQEVKSGRDWRTNGHSSRLLLSNVTTHNKENARLKVIESNKKKPHAFLDGNIESHCISDTEHNQIIAKLLARGAKYISYDPYKTKSFVSLDAPHLPKDCSELQPFTSAKLVYCFEDSVLAIL